AISARPPHAHLPALAPGELLAFLDTGAYGMTMASNYNGQPRPAEIVVSGGAARVARRPEAWEGPLATRAGARGAGPGGGRARSAGSRPGRRRHGDGLPWRRTDLVVVAAAWPTSCSTMSPGCSQTAARPSRT